MRNVEDIERALGVTSPISASWVDVSSGAARPRVRVVINTVGPFWKWGTNVVQLVSLSFLRL